ncbi:MAG TPA: HDIG domain-containing protein [Spirochaetota bacterium]|nr:HDIG domain-containing protein [Spirochaetota bacterium]HPI88425.1 HDIG domain-containing protein [Spirochaetota bacterium]HPR49894.1 HDIG domain-containing protein [Spirochaetota bacterium]
MNTHQTYPDRKQCLAIMEEHGMLPNIVSHSVQVMNVCLAIMARLRDPSAVDPSLVVASALLHDIAKTHSLENRDLRHDMLGGEMLRDMGYPAIAEIVESHVVFKNFNESGRLEEREIVYYADKRVMHDEIVSIDKRIEDLVERYGTSENIKKMILDNRDFITRLENKIRSGMTCDIDTALAEMQPVQP